MAKFRSCGFVCLLTFTFSFPQSGCSALKVKLGMRVDLTKTPVSSIEASLPQGPGIAPGQKSPLVVTVVQPDGKVLKTEGKGGGKVQWKDLTVTATVVTVNGKGIVSLAKDPRVSDGKVGHVTVTVPSHPDVRTELDIHYRYNVDFVSNFSGNPGSDGMNGTDGMSGIDGSPGSMDPNNPSPGGNGTNGGDGSPGQDGSNGGNAPAVQVMITRHSENDLLLEVSVSALNKRKLYLVDPVGGSLTVKADGGPAGSGGRGGRGGRGGAGGIGSPNGNSGSNGMDGRSGFDGSPGRGGLISVTYDPAVVSYLSVLHLSSKNGPTPVFMKAPLGPLW